MNSYERLFGRLAGKPVDRLPNLCIVMAYAAKEAGVSYREFVTDYRKLCDGMLRCHELYGIDCVSVISDPMREAQSFGTNVVFPENDVPYAEKPLFKSVLEITELTPALPENSPRMLDRIEAVEYLSGRCKGEVPIIGWVEGAFAEACDLEDMSTLMMELSDYPDEVHALLRECNQQAIRFAKAQIAAGADIVGIGDAAASLIGPTYYEEFALPYEIKLIEAIHKEGGKAKLHICGNINPLLQAICDTKADIVDCDWMVDIEKAQTIFGGEIAFCGNIDPVAVILQGTPMAVRMDVRRCISVKSSNSIIAGGCEIPLHTPP